MYHFLLLSQTLSVTLPTFMAAITVLVKKCFRGSCSSRNFIVESKIWVLKIGKHGQMHHKSDTYLPIDLFATFYIKLVGWFRWG